MSHAHDRSGRAGGVLNPRQRIARLFRSLSRASAVPAEEQAAPAMATEAALPAGLSADVDDLPRNPRKSGGPSAEAGDEEARTWREDSAESSLVQGNAAFRRAKFPEAISLFSEGLTRQQQDVLSLAQAAPGESTSSLSPSPSPRTPPALPLLLLSNRSAAFCRLSEHLRAIPAVQSERHALFGLDPLSLAQLALKDADKLIKDGGASWPKAHYRRARALMLVEKYSDAAEAFLEGLHLDPSNKLLQDGLRQLKTEREGELDSGSVLGADCDPNTAEACSRGVPGDEAEVARPQQTPEEQRGGEAKAKQGRKRAVERSDEFDCSLCLKLLFAPVTTPCGHTFCRSCLARAMDHGNKCPVCRMALFVNPSSQPVTVVLNNILEKHFPAEYLERKKEVEAEKLLCKETLPLFVMDVVLPRQRMALNIFEPRYRLMVRRCMEGSRTMGMVGFDQETGDIADVACEVEITECEPQPDGRFHLEVEGKRRFRVLKTWDLDGYRMAQAEWLHDEAVDSQTNPDQAVQANALAEQALTMAKKWVDDIMRNVKGGRRMRLAEYVRQAGETPPASQAENLSFWIANLLPTSPRDRLNFLRMTTTTERLSVEMGLLQAPERFSSCLVQ